jgi:two-component system sensor histidine kinase/response regulator
VAEGRGLGGGLRGQLRFARQIRASSDALLVLINDILDLAKIEAGKLELVLVELDLRAVVEEAVDAVASRALAKGLEVACFMPPRLDGRLLGDPDRLRQILLNLLSNAIKFTARGGVTLEVWEDAEPEAPGEAAGAGAARRRVRFSVRDTGIGIAEEAQRRLFSRFAQADAGTSRVYGGTGLGLAISKQVGSPLFRPTHLLDIIWC